MQRLPVSRVAILLTFAAMAAAEDRAARTAAELRRLLSPFGIDVASPEALSPAAGALWRQWRVAWNRPGGPLARDETPSTRTLEVVGSRALPAAPARPRSFELSAEHLLVVAVDARRHLRSWTAIRDPRRLRAETTDDDGHWIRAEAADASVFADGMAHRRDVELTLEVPDRGVAQVHLYQPRWNGAAFALDRVGTLAIGSR